MKRSVRVSGGNTTHSNLIDRERKDLTSDSPQRIRLIEGFVVFGVSYVVSVLVAALFGYRLSVKLVAAISTVSLLATGLILLSIIRFPPFNLLGRWRIKPGLIALSVASSLAIIPCALTVEGLVLKRFGIPEHVIRALLEILRARDTLELLLVWSFAGLGAALGEELLFRGVLQRSLYGAIKGWQAVIISGIIFGVLHNPWRMASATLLGIYIGFLYLLTDCLVVAIVAHLTINSFAILVLYISEHSRDYDLPKWMSESTYEAVLPPFYLVAISAIMFALLMWQIAKHRVASQVSEPCNQV